VASSAMQVPNADALELVEHLLPPKSKAAQGHRKGKLKVLRRRQAWI